MKLIKIDSSPVDFKYEGGLKPLQDAVGGYIEIVRTPNGKLLVLDEEGKLKNKALNVVATKLSGLFPHDYIAGDALLAEEGEIE